MFIFNPKYLGCFQQILTLGQSLKNKLIVTILEAKLLTSNSIDLKCDHSLVQPTFLSVFIRNFCLLSPEKSLISR